MSDNRKTCVSYNEAENTEHEYDDGLFGDNNCHVGEEDCGFANLPSDPSESIPEESNIALLPQDHPLMKKFQKLLKAHLLRAKEDILNQLSDVQIAIKKKEALREETGVKLYDMQEDLKIQEIQLQEYENTVQEHIKLREAEEETIERLQKEFNAKELDCKELKQKYNKRMMELEHVNELELSTRQWVDEVEDSVKNAKRTVNRDAQMQQQLNDEKRRSDILFFRLDLEVKRNEQELTILQHELNDMNDVRDVLNTSLANANADLTVLQNEHKRLIMAWGEVIVSISHRDKIMHELHVAIDKEKENIKNDECGIQALKKQISNEMKQQEKLLNFKSRIIDDFNTLRMECIRQAEILRTLENKLEEMPLLLKQTEDDLHEAKKEGAAIDSELNRVIWRIDRLCKRKFELEEEILKVAQDQLIADKASKYRVKLLRDAQEKRRVADLSLAQAQNQLSDVLLQIELLKGNLVHLQTQETENKAKVYAIEKKYDRAVVELKSIEDDIDLKLSRIERLNRELEDHRRKTEIIPQNPVLQKIKLLEKSMQTAEQQLREHQQFWLMMQNHFVNLSQKRQTQLTEIQMTGKQLSVIKQKGLKVDGDLERAQSEMQQLAREVQMYVSKVSLLNAKMFHKQYKHEVQETECERKHDGLIHNLKEEELKVLKMEEEINEIQDDIDLLKDLVLEKHRETLSWETKYKLIEETLQWRKQERGKESELTVMKNEIHRMEVRHQQLKRAQDKLMQDLEHCVMHRERIYDNTTRRQKVESKLQQKSKAPTSLQTQVSDMRNKIKINEAEIINLSGPHMQQMTADAARIRLEIEQLRSDIESTKAENIKTRQAIEDAILQKHINIEKIVRDQGYAKSYRKLASNASPPHLGYSESALELQRQKQMEMNENLQDVVQTLCNEYAEHLTFFNKTLNTLKL